MHLQSLTHAELVEHGVCAKLAHTIKNPSLYDKDLEFLIGETNWDYCIPDNVRDVVPLWDRNADAIVRWCREGKIEYVLLLHDDPNWILIATSEQGVKAELWSNWCEFHEETEECRRFAEAIGFSHCDEALRIWEQDYDEFEGWKLTLSD